MVSWAGGDVADGLTVANTSLNHFKKKKIPQHKLGLDVAFCCPGPPAWLPLVTVAAESAKDARVLNPGTLKGIFFVVSAEGEAGFVDVESGHTSVLNRFVLAWPPPAHPSVNI